MSKLLPKQLKRKLLDNHRKARRDESYLSLVPVVKFFTPDAGASWIISHAEELSDDLILWGWCDLGVGFPEYGPVSLRELEAVTGKFGLPVERDRYFSTSLTIGEYGEQNSVV